MLDTELKGLIRTTQSRLDSLSSRGVRTLSELLLNLPWRYCDETEFGNVADLNAQDAISVQGEVKNVALRRTRSGKSMLVAKFFDESGEVEVLWFGQVYLKQVLKPGVKVVMTGKVKFASGKNTLMSPRVEIIKLDQELKHSGRLVPVYHEYEQISSKWLREKIHPLLYATKFFKENLPSLLLERFSLMPRGEALSQVHFPENEQALKNARFRLGFEEMLVIQLGVQKRKFDLKQVLGDGSLALVLKKEWCQQYLDLLPFTLTAAQQKSLDEILQDLANPEPMSRLVEGDVGSGKTVVAFMAMFLAYKNKKQAMLMAPTEILAKQHLENAMTLFKSLGVNVQLLSGSMTKKQKNEIKMGLSTGLIDMVFGTHALIQDTVEFKDLGLAVIDEQHRFGVSQRAFLKRFGSPHMLSMTATPIPRTLALTIYGDQDLSIIDEKPAGRKDIITRKVPEKKRAEACMWIESQVQAGRQAYIVCPLVEDSDFMESKSVSAEYERLSQEVFPHLRLALLHGRMKQSEKDQIMLDFKEKKIDILVSTTVIEVGIDVPNASIIVIEDADRFGLAQLHQLRGRVGRGEHQSYCFLFVQSFSENTRERMKAMVNFSDGFKLAEIDLDLRGPGEVYGFRQSGIPDLKMASLTDAKLVKMAQEAAELLMKHDPSLESYPDLLAEVYKGVQEIDL